MNYKNQFLLIFIFFINSIAQTFAIDVYTKHVLYYIPQDKQYLETQIKLDVATLRYTTNAEKKISAYCEFLILFKQKDKIIQFDKFKYTTPEFTNIDDILKNTNEILIVRKNYLEKGDYDIEIELNSQDSIQKLKTEKISVPQYSNNKTFMANISLNDTFFFSKNDENQFVKNSYQINPLVTNYYTSYQNSLSLYTEIYFSNKDIAASKKYLLKSSIVDATKPDAPVSIENTQFVLSDTVAPVLSMMDISKLKSGKYKLKLNLFDRQNNLVSFSEIEFDRSKIQNMLTNQNAFDTSNFINTSITGTFVTNYKYDELAYRLSTMMPTATVSERQYIDNLIRSKNLVLMQQFFYNYWFNKNPADPMGEYSKYNEIIEMLNSNFATPNRYGYLSERGRVYLQYGAPNYITKAHNNMDTYPYEVWEYYDTGIQKNIRFLFYCKDLATNNYILGYSNARGELTDPAWAAKLQANAGNPNFDSSGYRNTPGSNLERNLNLLRLNLNDGTLMDSNK